MNYANTIADMMKNPQELLKNAVDMNQIMTTGRRNMEAASEAGQVVVESAQTISRRTSEIARESMETTLKASKDLFTSGTPETNIAKQAEFAKAAIESSLANVRELSEMMAKSCFEAFDVFSRRATESIEELSKATGAAAPASKKKSA